jgi:hypothetical protein
MNVRIDPFYRGTQHNAPGGAANVTILTDQIKLIWLINDAAKRAILNRIRILADQQLRVRAVTPFAQLRHFV